MDTVSSFHGFPFLKLPSELQLQVYSYVLPKHGRLLLDPQNIYHPLPYVKKSCPDALNLLLSCKKIHAEVTQLIFAKNMVNVINPIRGGDVLKRLGAAACQHLTTVECHVHEDIAELHLIWSTMKTCPNLTNLRLIFFHVKRNWLTTMAKLTYGSLEQQAAGGAGVQLNLELYCSIWAHEKSNSHYTGIFQKALSSASPGSIGYAAMIPSPIRRITVTASVSKVPAGAFACAIDGTGWHFERTAHITGPPEAYHYRLVNTGDPCFDKIIKNYGSSKIPIIIDD